MKFSFIVLVFLIFHGCTPKEEQATTATSTSSSTEKNKELIKRVYTDMANKQNYALIDSFCALNILDHGAMEGQEQGREGFKKAVIGFLGMFSKVEIKQGDMIAEGDLVATRETWTVTRASDNKILTGETMHFFRIKDGLITDEWSKGWEWLGPGN